jgi:sterol 14-demethylase
MNSTVLTSWPPAVLANPPNVVSSALEFVRGLSTSALLALIFVGFPALAIAINILRQLLIPQDPSLPPEVFHLIPVFGSAASYGDDPLGFFFKCREKYGDIFTFTLLGRKMTVALGAKGNSFILGGKLSHVCAEDAYTHLTTPVFGKNVVYDCPNSVLMEQKKFIKSGLSTDNFRKYVPLIEEEVELFFNTHESFKEFREGKAGSFFAMREMAELVILTASKTLQGHEVRKAMAMDGGEYATLYRHLDEGFTPLNFMFPNLPLPSYRRRDRAQQRMAQFYLDIMRHREENGLDLDGHDMLANLADQAYKSGRPLSREEQAHIMIALLLAGQHTSSTTTAWCLIHLAHRPDVAQQLYEEQVTHFGNPDGTFQPLDYDKLRELPVVDSVIRETLRLHPPIHSIMRKVINDLEVPPTLGSPSSPKTDNKRYVIPKGYFVLACPAVSQVDPHIWRDAPEWNPSRWSDPTGEAARAFKAYADPDGEKIDYGFGAVSKGTESPYQPFGAGRHRCIGEQFAYLQIGTIISSFVRRIEMARDALPVHNYHTMIVMPTEPSDVKYTPRSS